MCGRFFLTAKQQDILAAAETTETAFEHEEYQPRFNIAPTQQTAIVSAGKGGERVLGAMRWNLRPHFWKPGTPELSLINLRFENAFTKPVWRNLVARRRCVIPFSGFYEWKALGSGGAHDAPPAAKGTEEPKGTKAAKGTTKQPLRIEEPGGGVSFFAGVWDRWEDANGQRMTSFSILTMPANAALAGIHDRMPVTLTRSGVDTWLDRSVEDLERLHRIALAGARVEFVCTPVSTRVNSPRNDDASLLFPV